MKIILLRHGESDWNLKNKFTGWEDISLTPKGINEAKFAGKQLVKEKINISSIHTSILSRATETTEIVCDIINFSKKNIIYDWRLNERHYGSLQGLNKSETALKYGEKQVHIWRRSYDIPPPSLLKNDKRHPRFVKKFKKIGENLPSGESLKNVVERLNPFWKEYLNFINLNYGNHLIVAHSNSLRAIIKILENLSKNEIMDVNIPTGVPLVYDFDDNFKIINKNFLINDEDLFKKQKQVANQGKINK
tara:strand:- start:13360 stop:14103 length:744 start_codon:yes stop_codon:yes gene_type:complete